MFKFCYYLLGGEATTCLTASNYAPVDLCRSLLFYWAPGASSTLIAFKIPETKAIPFSPEI
jgi:hypothetical protein